MDRQAMIRRLGGCYLAVPTLFNDDLSLNLDGIGRHIEFLIACGIREGNATILVNGAAGEFPVLSLEERRQTAEAAVRAAGGKIAVIVGAQATGTREACAIALHAQAIGATALQVSAPFYYLLTDDDVYEHFAAVANAAPKLGIVVYTTYWLTHRPSLQLLERLAEIPQVVAVKWASPDIVEYQLALLRFAGRLGVIDNQLLPVFNQMMGGSGVNLHPALFWPEWGVRVWGLLEARRWDEAQQGLPLHMSAEVIALSDGPFHYDGPMFAGLQGNMGPSAHIRQGGLHVLLVTQREQPFDRAFARTLGLDPRTMRYIGVKSAAHFRADFESWAGAIYLVSEPSVHNTLTGDLRYHRLGRKLFPIDAI